MTLTDVGTRYNGMELSPGRVAAFFKYNNSKTPEHYKQPLPERKEEASPPTPLRKERGVNSVLSLYIR